MLTGGAPGAEPVRVPASHFDPGTSNQSSNQALQSRSCQPAEGPAALLLPHGPLTRKHVSPAQNQARTVGPPLLRGPDGLGHGQGAEAGDHDGPVPAR